MDAYQAAKKCHSESWSGDIRDWHWNIVAHLNPDKMEGQKEDVISARTAA